ncbi:hypothetical protein, partial [Glycomyces tenuis]
GKPSGGEQHPNGDADALTAVLARNGDGQAFINLQDHYPDWPYQNDGIEAYQELLREIVPAMEAEPNADRLVYVPFNEPDWIWYGLSSGEQEDFDRFLADWTSTYRLLKELAPDTPVAGPNEAYFHREFMPRFLEHARDTDTLPQYMTWHELSPNSLRDFRGNHADYRAMESELGIDPIPININEYGNNRDLSVPGQLVQWASMFEDTKVYADMAYWTAAGGYSGSAPQTNVPNGGWWFFKTYSGMTGQTVEVAPPSPETIDTLQGVATVDADREHAQVLLGGTAEDFDVALEGLTAGFWGDEVTATVHRIAWTGYEGTSPAPVPIGQVTGSPEDLEIGVSDPDPMAAYWITVVPGEGAGIDDEPWHGAWEAEDAAITSGQVVRQGHPGNGNGFAASGTYDVGYLAASDSAVEFTVNVPKRGTYDLDIFYAHMYGRDDAVGGRPSQQVLGVNGEERLVDYPSTMNWQHRSIVTEQVELRKGENTITLAKSGAVGTANGEVTLDKIELTRHVKHPETVYDGEFARTAGEDLVFDVYAPADGYYDIDGADEAVLVGPQNQNAAVDLKDPVFLPAGVNRLRTGGEVEALTVAHGRGDVTAIGADEAVLSGGAELSANEFAEGGQVITGVGGGGTAALEIDAAEEGPHVLLIHYANDERTGGHAYNIDIVSRWAEIAVDGEEVLSVPMRGTWSWNDFWSFPVIVDLQEGANTITIGNADGFTADFDRFEVAPLNP